MSMVDYPLSENRQPSFRSFREPSSSHRSRHNQNQDGGLGQGSYHNSSSRYNSNRSPPRRFQSHIGISNSNHSNKSFRKSPNRSQSKNYDPLAGGSNHSTRSNGSSFQHSYKKPMMPGKQLYLAMDCEMVGTITGASVAARVVLVDWKGRKVYDSYMKPKEEVSDYRTFVSGVTEEHLENAPSSDEVLIVVRDLLKDKILVGHGLDNDLKALGLTHPWNMTRDTAYYQPFMRLLDGSAVWGPRKLKDLAKEKLQREIQVAGVSHCPVEDAAAALDLYKSHRPRWEACMSNEEKRARQQALQEAAAAAAANMYTHDFDELTPMNSSMHSYSYHGGEPTASNTYHHQSSFHQNYTQEPRLKRSIDPLQSQSFHYPRSHTMAEYRDYGNKSDFLDSNSYHHSTSMGAVDEFGVSCLHELPRRSSLQAYSVGHK